MTLRVSILYFTILLVWECSGRDTEENMAVAIFPLSSRTKIWEHVISTRNIACLRIGSAGAEKCILGIVFVLNIVSIKPQATPFWSMYNRSSVYPTSLAIYKAPTRAASLGYTDCSVHNFLRKRMYRWGRICAWRSRPTSIKTSERTFEK